jgi:hypothetical protein
MNINKFQPRIVGIGVDAANASEKLTASCSE